jgi:hypothetical protein
MRQDLAKGLVMARSRIPILPEISFYPVFRQTPGIVNHPLDPASLPFRPGFQPMTGGSIHAPIFLGYLWIVMKDPESSRG